jgi:hypothetical protein
MNKVFYGAWGAIFFSLSCQPVTEPGESLLDTGWFEDTGVYDEANCPHYVVSVLPEDGVEDWYVRDVLRVYTSSTRQDEYAVSLRNETLEGLSIALLFDDEQLYFDVIPDEGLLPLTEYVLDVTDCQGTQSVTFYTSELGLPVEGGVSELVGNAYLMDMVGANWVQPVSIGGLMALYFTTPVVFGVQWADASTLDLVAAPGAENLAGEVVQNLLEPSWSIPAVSFEEQPHFETIADEILFVFQGEEFPVHDFVFSGTFSADGEQIGGGLLTGLGDTRNLGAFFEAAGDPGGLCKLAGILGVYCEDCPDGEPYCLALEAIDLDGTLVEGLTLQETN